jgi:hypothetical protein
VIASAVQHDSFQTKFKAIVVDFACIQVEFQQILTDYDGAGVVAPNFGQQCRFVETDRNEMVNVRGCERRQP